jgi:hypothetical protein
MGYYCGRDHDHFTSFTTMLSLKAKKCMQLRKCCLPPSYRNRGCKPPYYGAATWTLAPGLIV